MQKRKSSLKDLHRQKVVQEAKDNSLSFGYKKPSIGKFEKQLTNEKVL